MQLKTFRSLQGWALRNRCRFWSELADSLRSSLVFRQDL